MGTPTTGAWRATRALLVVVTVLGLASAGHLVAGGVVAPGRSTAPALLLAATLVALGAAVLTSARLTPARLLGALGVGQVVVHEALNVGTAPGAHCYAPVGSEVFQAVTVVPCTAGAAGGHQALWSDPWMLAAHVVATLVTAAVLLRGDRVLWAARALLGRRPLVLPDAHVPETAPAPVASARVVPPRGAVLDDLSPVRGPPAGVLASRVLA